MILPQSSLQVKAHPDNILITAFRDFEQRIPLSHIWYMHAMEYYSVIKKNERMPLAATWMQLEITILTKSKRERQIPYDITYIWNLNYDASELIYEIDRDSQT